MGIVVTSSFDLSATSADDKAAVSAVSAVSAVLAASYPELMAPSYDSALLAATLGLMTQANPALLTSGTYYVAESEDGSILGCGGWTRERPHVGGVAAGLGHIRHFAVHPDWTGHRVGRALYSQCEQVARAAGIQHFECNASLNAEGFDGALGFELVRRIDVPRLDFPQSADDARALAMRASKRKTQIVGAPRYDDMREPIPIVRCRCPNRFPGSTTPSSICWPPRPPSPRSTLR